MNNFDPKIQSILTLLNTNDSVHLQLIKELMKGQTKNSLYVLCYDLIFSLLSYHGGHDIYFFSQVDRYKPTSDILIQFDDNGRLFRLNPSIWCDSTHQSEKLFILAQALLIIRDTIFWAKDDLTHIIDYLPTDQWYLIFQKLVTKQLSGVKHLDLSGLNMKSIPYGLNLISELVSLDLSQNQIKDIDYPWNGLPALRYIDLSSNLISKIPDSFLTTGLQSVSIQNNKLSFRELKWYSSRNLDLRTVVFQQESSSLAISILEKQVNLGVIQKSKEEQMRQLLPYFTFAELRFKPSNTDIVSLLNDDDRNIRKKTLEYIYNSKARTITDTKNMVLAIAGKVSFDMIRNLEKNRHRFKDLHTVMNQNASHILIGELPGDIFLSKDQILICEQDMLDVDVSQR